MSHSKRYVYCFVPGCGSSSVSTPRKLFFHVPNGERRKQWNIAVGRPGDSLSMKSKHRCCEDHFQMEEDVNNWLYYKTLRESRPETAPCLRLKKDVVPHLLLPKAARPAIDYQTIENGRVFVKCSSQKEVQSEAELSNKTEKRKRSSQYLARKGRPPKHSKFTTQRETKNEENPQSDSVPSQSSNSSYGPESQNLHTASSQDDELMSLQLRAMMENFGHHFLVPP